MAASCNDGCVGWQNVSRNHTVRAYHPCGSVDEQGNEERHRWVAVSQRSHDKDPDLHDVEEFLEVPQKNLRTRDPQSYTGLMDDVAFDGRHQR